MRIEPPSHFADRLILRSRQLGHPLCVGLDPHLDLIPSLFQQGSMDPRDPQTARAVEHFLLTVLDRVATKVAIVKPQIAFFERLGAAGIVVLENVVQHARKRGLEVLLDAKRGDIGSTARGYGAAYFGDLAPCRVDALTVNPYLGFDTISPFLEAAVEDGGGIFVLAKTSNPGSGDFQNRPLADGGTLHEAVAARLSQAASEARGRVTGFSSLGVVVGATYPGESETVRRILPHSLFLVPGYGAQGGSAADALRGFVAGPVGREGGIVNSSRGILFAAGEVDSAAAWERAFDGALRRAIAELGEAVAG